MRGLVSNNFEAGFFFVPNRLWGTGRKRDLHTSDSRNLERDAEPPNRVQQVISGSMDIVSRPVRPTHTHTRARRPVQRKKGKGNKKAQTSWASQPANQPVSGLPG